MIIIGEKINGAIPSTSQAIKDRDAYFIRDLAIKQVEAGAEYIDVCAVSLGKCVGKIFCCVHLMVDKKSVAVQIDPTDGKFVKIDGLGVVQYSADRRGENIVVHIGDLIKNHTYTS